MCCIQKRDSRCTSQASSSSYSSTSHRFALATGNTLFSTFALPFVGDAHLSEHFLLPFSLLLLLRLQSQYLCIGIRVSVDRYRNSSTGFDFIACRSPLAFRYFAFLPFPARRCAAFSIVKRYRAIGGHEGRERIMLGCRHRRLLNLRNNYFGSRVMASQL